MKCVGLRTIPSTLGLYVVCIDQYRTAQSFKRQYFMMQLQFFRTCNRISESHMNLYFGNQRNIQIPTFSLLRFPLCQL
jgi:hypothetical protein